MGLRFAMQVNKLLETPMKTSTIAHLTLAALLSAGLTMAHTPAAAGSTKATAATGASKGSEPAIGKKKARKPPSSASNPGTSGGAGNRSGDDKKDGASFEAPSAGKGASKPTGTGWD